MPTARPQPARPILPKEAFYDFSFPKAGVDLSRGFSQQLPRPMADGQYASTTPVGNNVRTYEPTTGRARGGSRPGLKKYNTAQPNGTTTLQELNCLVGVGYSAPGGSVQTSSSGRVVSLIAVSGGNIYAASPGGMTWNVAANNTGRTTPLVATGIVLSSPNNQKLYFADGTNYSVYNPNGNRVDTWAATAGTLPVDTAGNTPRLIETWRGRTVVSGLTKDPQNWFMSAVSDPTDFNYARNRFSPAGAIDGNDSPLGLIGDVVTSLVPYSDDVLVVGGDHTIYQFNGDPMGGGQIDLVSDTIGMAWGRPWCKGPDGTLYFVSNRMGIYAMIPRQGPPQRISQQIEQLLVTIDTGANTIRLIWDDRFQGLHVFVTLTASQAATTHFFWEQRAGAWWTDSFTLTAHNPLTVCVFDGNLPGDRVPLIGSWDGYVRSIDPAATTDDGTAIASSVIMGPITSKTLDDFLCKSLQALLGESSGTVTYAVYSGSSAEKALASNPVATGTWNAGRNLTNLVRRAGHALYLKITANNPWALEQIRAVIAGPRGKVRQRGR